MITSRKPRPSIRRGAVYFMQHSGVYSVKPHFHVVLNKKPLEDDRVYTAVITSQVEKVKKYTKQPQTIVEFGPKDYRGLTKPSAIDCNSVVGMRTKDFKEAVEKSIAKPRRDFPPHLLEKVIAGIKVSTKVSGNLKDLLC